MTEDADAAHNLDTAQEVSINGTSTLVNVTNYLGQDVTITVTLRDDSTHLGDLIVDDTNYGNEVSFYLAKSGTETVSVEVPDDSSLTDESIYFHVNASSSGITANAPDRRVPVNS